MVPLSGHGRLRALVSGQNHGQSERHVCEPGKAVNAELHLRTELSCDGAPVVAGDPACLPAAPTEEAPRQSAGQLCFRSRALRVAPPPARSFSPSGRRSPVGETCR